MTTEEVKFIRLTGRRPFKFRDILDYYIFIIFPLAIFSSGTFLFINTFGHGDKAALYSSIIFIFGLVLLLWTVKRLRDNQIFRRIRTSRNSDENILKIKNVIERLEWELYLDNKERVIAFTGTTGFFSSQSLPFRGLCANTGRRGAESRG